MSDTWLADHLRGAAWMDDVGRAAQRFQIMDAVDLDGVAGSRSLLLLAPRIIPSAGTRCPWTSR